MAVLAECGCPPIVRVRVVGYPAELRGAELRALTAGQSVVPCLLEEAAKEELPMRLPGKSRHAMGVRQQRLQILLWRAEEGLHLGHRAIVISSPLGRRQGLQLGQTGAGIGKEDLGH